MANLKAFVRIDGRGVIVPGSTILRKKKPAVGRWREVAATECCEETTTTTTTTTAAP